MIPLDETGYSVSSLSASNVTDTIRLQWLVEGRCDGIILSRSYLDRLSKKSDKICDFWQLFEDTLVTLTVGDSYCTSFGSAW